MSLFGQRLLATIVALWVVAIAGSPVVVAAQPDSTWVALSPLPNQPRSALFALAVDPFSNQLVIAGDARGSLFRTTNGGASWKSVHSGKSSISTIAFSPSTQGFVLAGTRGAGVLLSRDSGATWTAARGLDGRTVRAFAFALTLIAAGTDRGVYLSADGLSWSQSGLANRNINALAVEAIHTPVRLIAGGDSPSSGSSLPLFETLDGGASWKQISPAISGTIAVRLASGPLPPTGNVRPLLLGTNTGLFHSRDNGATFAPLSGGGLLPTTDYTQTDFITVHYDRFYVASDGADSGGRTTRVRRSPRCGRLRRRSPRLPSPTMRSRSSMWLRFDRRVTPRRCGPTTTRVVRLRVPLARRRRSRAALEPQRWAMGHSSTSSLHPRSCHTSASGWERSR